MQLVVQSEPNSAKHHNNLGYVLLRKNDIARAVWYFKKAVELDPGMYQPYCNLVVCLSQLPAIDPADAQWVDRALELAPANNYRLYIHAAAVYRRLRNAEPAKQDVWEAKIRNCLDTARLLGCPEAIIRGHTNGLKRIPALGSLENTYPNAAPPSDSALDQVRSLEFGDYYIPPS
ncbi:MAG: hypothetical protein KatS3mg110_3929 [Pirellulaceae bacterium]|nr:MAG: hypothetical protein KatS3mg110_3929 [Pirellulaceae bacterium]